MLLSAKEIIKNILVDCNLQIIDIFEDGTCKIEFMVSCNDEIISISIVEDGSYDFMIFTSDGDTLIYSNTEKLTSINQLRELIYKDLRMSIEEWYKKYNLDVQQQIKLEMETFLDSFMEYGIEIASDDIVKIKSELSKIEINVVAIRILDWLELERKRELWIEAGRKTKLKPLQLNFKYDWCNNLKKMVEKWKVFEKYFYIVEDKFDFLPEVDEATRTAIRDSVYKNYNPTSPRKNIGIVKK